MEHIVRPGETLSSIANSYAISTIMQANRLHNGLIYPGQRLFIPQPPAHHYHTHTHTHIHTSTPTSMNQFIHRPGHDLRVLSMPNTEIKEKGCPLVICDDFWEQLLFFVIFTLAND
jgi:LysM repeat protein